MYFRNDKVVVQSDKQTITFGPLIDKEASQAAAAMPDEGIKSYIPTNSNLQWDTSYLSPVITQPEQGSVAETVTILNDSTLYISVLTPFSGNDSLVVQGLQAVSTTTLAPIYLSMNLNNHDIRDYIIEQETRIGQPSIEFAGGEQIFVLSDGEVAADDILYRESVAGTAIPDEHIRIYIPGNPSIDWQTGGSASLVQGSGDIMSGVTIDNDTLLVRVNSALSGDAVVQISGVQLDLGSAESDTTLLGMLVNRVNGDDNTMDTTSHIRVGDPDITSYDQIFVLSDPSGSDSLLIRPITIAEGSVPVITSSDDIELTLPGG